MNQSPVSFLDCTICRMRKTLLLVSLIPDRLLSALIKAHTKCHGTLGRKRLIVTICHIFKINLSGSLLCNQRKFAKARRTKESVYNFLSLTLSARLFHPVGYTVSKIFFFFSFFLLASQSMTQNRRPTLVTVLMLYMALLLPFVISEIPYNKGHSFYQHDK